MTDGTTTLTTRKAPAELEEPLVGQFHLKITDADTHKTAYDGACAAAVPVKEGVYDLHVTYGDESAVALDAPLLHGGAPKGKKWFFISRHRFPSFARWPIPCCR